MKTFMLRGREKESWADPDDCSSSLKYGVWYNMVTPFGWYYFKLKKGSKYVEVYDYPKDKKPLARVSRKRFLNRFVTVVKAPIEPVEELRLKKYGIK